MANIDYNGPTWKQAYEDGKAGKNPDPSQASDPNYEDGWLTGDAERMEGPMPADKLRSEAEALLVKAIPGLANQPKRAAELAASFLMDLLAADNRNVMVHRIHTKSRQEELLAGFKLPEPDKINPELLAHYQKQATTSR